ncbi:c-type cytochrome [Bremerella alba]|uniref:c-type cytochrome n=1 Tax=Bremerella alba TaxID=980252 RepID=UPI001A9562B8|nr:c-type cytochrome [Bremerella alba]
MLLASFGSIAWGQDREAPFVAGFERFARHGVVESNMGGQLLLSELSCTACHTTDSLALIPKRGPHLTGTGNRIQADWIRAFLNSPHQVKPGTTMPDVLAPLPEDEREEAVEALVAFLSTQHRPFPEARASGANPLPHEFWNNGNAARGEKLFHLVGCVACHAPDPNYQGGHSQPSAMSALLSTLDPEDIEEMGLTESARPVPSVPLPDLSAKYTTKALTFFLTSPETVRPGVRMPNLKLDLVEAADLAAYLTQDAAPKSDQDALPENSPLVENGKRLFTSLSCVNCHNVEGLTPTTQAKSLADLNVNDEIGCLGDPALGLPHYGLDEVQVDSITSALTQLGSQEREPSKDVSLKLSLLQQNCYACHQRDELGGIGPDREKFFETVSHVDLGDEGRLPPPLTHVGRKLKSSWFTKVLAGSGDIRPHMLVRMPKFPKHLAERLPDAFAEADQSAPVPEADVFPKLTKLEDPGRRLLNNGCVQCHPVRGESVPGAVGVDLASVTQRVRPEWFLEFLRNPAELKDRTRMPSFFPGGKSAIPEILDGDMDHQIAAMWSYLKDVKSQKLPEKIEEARAQEFELIPKERPILIRTFMESAGPHAIAVGFPQRVHYAFDAEQMQLTQAWRGRFLDAYGTWFVRSAPPASPLESEVVSLPADSAFAQLPRANDRWPAGTENTTHYRFLGYGLDPQGVPTLRYRYRGFEIEDRIEPTDEGGLKRSLSITSPDEESSEGKLWFRAHRGTNLKLQDNSCTEPDGVTVTLEVPNDDAVLWQDPDNPQTMEWRVPVRTDRKLEVTYQW